jgi:hypothetical protein
VTLVTGDRVPVTPGAAAAVVAVEPGPGRGARTFSITYQHGSVYVTPVDAVPLVASGLDKAIAKTG